MTGHETSSTAGDLTIRDAEVNGRIVDVGIVDGLVVAVGRRRQVGSAGEVIDARGGALLPGLVDHHVHLLAFAAAMNSVDVTALEYGDEGLDLVLRRSAEGLTPGQWLRVVGYHAGIAGDLDRDLLDRICSDRPVRVQDRSGIRWTLNSAAVRVLGIETLHDPRIERDCTGRATGRLHRGDDLLQRLQPGVTSPDLAAVGAAFVASGVTAVMDATPFDSAGRMELLASAVLSGALPLRVAVMGGVELVAAEVPQGLEWGPVKIIIDDLVYPDLDGLEEAIRVAHRSARPVAIHCVTRPALVLALAALEAAGVIDGDRIEHGAVIPDELVDVISGLGLRIVTQPSFVADRGDDYLEAVDSDDLPFLYRVRSLLDAGIRVAASSDAPYTHPDPWAAMRAAVERRSRSGTVLGGDERIDWHRALEMYLSPLGDPGGPPRTIASGVPGDLCLLDGPLSTVLTDAGSGAHRVVATIRGGVVVHRRP